MAKRIIYISAENREQACAGVPGPTAFLTRIGLHVFDAEREGHLCLVVSPTAALWLIFRDGHLAILEENEAGTLFMTESNSETVYTG
jgi:hypothetical protein